MSSMVRDRAIDVAIAATLAILPLLPAGPTYFGWRWPWALEAVFLVASMLALLLVLTTRAPDRLRSDRHRLHRIVARGYLTWLIPMVGAMVIGLLERNPPDLAMFRIEADGLISRLALPMNQVADRLYPLRVGLTVLEGGAMFLLLSAALRRTDAPRRRAQAAFTGFLAGMAMVSVVAVVQYVTRANLHQYWVRMNPNLTRSHATLDDPNALASFLVLGIGLAIGVAWSTGSVRRRSVAIGIGVLACVALVTTVSRAGIVALAIAGVIVTAAVPDRLIGTARYAGVFRRAARFAILVGFVAVAVWGIAFAVLPKSASTVVPDTPLEALLRTVDPRESVSTLLKGRHLIWQAGLQIVAANWIAGAGLGQFPRLVASYPGAGGAENAHNYFLQVFAEGGIVALAGLLVLVTTIAWTMYRVIRHGDSVTARLALGLSCGLIAFVLTWLTGHPLLTLSNQLWFAAVLAAGLAAVDMPQGAVREPSVTPVAARGARAVAYRSWVPIVVFVTLLVLIPRALDAAAEGARRRYAVGVYGWEPAPPSEAWPTGTTFRWTRGRAAIREPVGGRVLQLPFFLARPDIDSQQVVVDIKIGGTTVPSSRFTKNGWHVLTYDLAALLGSERWRSQGVVSVELTVHPTFVPATLLASPDTRELGIGVGALHWQE